MQLSLAYPLPFSCCSKRFNFFKNRTPSFFVSSSLRLDDLSQIVHNKVLICTTTATVLGQLSKPLTSAFNGKGFDFGAAMRSGGMPSVHSASAVAAATAIGLERGFADSLFGLALVFAVIVMYDAQGVRKEVGLHAKVINTKLLTEEDSSAVAVKFGPTSVGDLQESEVISGEAYETDRFRDTKLQMQGIERDMIRFGVKKNVEELEYTRKHVRLKESVGHQEIEVAVGAVFGFLLAIGVDVIL